MSDGLWLAIRWLHVLAMALFVGGQMFLVIAVIPVLRSSDRREALRSIARRFGSASVAALVVLIATGTALPSRGDRWDSETMQVKLALVLTVTGLIVWHLRRPTAHAIEGLIFLVSLAIVWLGLALAHGPLPFGRQAALQTCFFPVPQSLQTALQSQSKPQS
jgi:hypothetical protein